MNNGARECSTTGLLILFICVNSSMYLPENSSMYAPENATIITRISSDVGSDPITKSHSDLYILFAFMGFVLGSFLLFFTINVSKARFGARKDKAAFVIDLPPRYSEVVPPTYEWALKHHYSKDQRLKGYSTSNLKTMIVVCNCLLPVLLQYCY